MNGWLADAGEATGDNPWLEAIMPRLRRERRRKSKAMYKTHGNGPWVPSTPITPALMARAVAHLRVLYSMEGTADVL